MIKNLQREEELMRKKLYFGHPINIYDTDVEVRLLRKISEAFPEWDIENPNQKHHADGYEHWKKTTGKGMDYFFKVVLPSCHGGIFLPFRDGKWGAGVFGEAKYLSEKGCPIWQITAEGTIRQSNLDEAEILTVEETCSRIRTPSGETKAY